MFLKIYTQGIRNMRSFIAALTFLTIIPLPRRYTDNADFSKCEKYFPLIGLLIGLILVAAYSIYMLIFPPLISATLTVFTLIKITGGLHMDGLSDMADAFLSHRDKEKTMEIMKDSRIGSMGALAQSGVILLKIAAVYELSSLTLGGLLLAPVVGRSAILLVSNSTPHARTNGLGNLVNPSKNKSLLIYSILTSLILAALSLGWRGIICTIISLVTAVIISKISIRKIGGFTGDILGATCEICEMLTLLMLTAFI